MKELLVDAINENLEAVINFIENELDERGCDMKSLAQINIAVEEIFLNIANYAYSPDIGGAVIRVSVGDDVVIEFEDKGTPYNPLSKMDPNTTLSADERVPGGLGIFMVKNIMDDVEYKHEEHKNILTIRKTI